MGKVSISSQIGYVSVLMAVVAITVYMLYFFAILVVNPLRMALSTGFAVLLHELGCEHAKSGVLTPAHASG